MTDPTASQVAQRDEHTRVILLVGQSISLGLFASLLLITANSLFLATFGSAALPYAYLAVAALGAVTFYALAILQRTWPLPRLALLIDLSLVAAALAGWLALTAGLVWVSFLLVVAIPLSIQAGFVVLGGQVGSPVRCPPDQAAVPARRLRVCHRFHAGRPAQRAAAGLAGQNREPAAAQPPPPVC